MSSSVSSVIIRSHYANTTKFASYLIAALLLDVEEDFRYDSDKFSIYKDGFTSSRLRSLISQLNNALSLFKSSFIVQSNFFESVSSADLLLQAPNALIILFEHSNLSLRSRISLFKKIFPKPFTLSPVCWSILHRWYQALELGDVYKDSMELIYSNPPYITFTSRETWSPHIGVSFGHLPLIFEHLMSIDLLESSNSVEAAYITAPSQFNAYGSFPFARIVESASIQNFQTYDVSKDNLVTPFQDLLFTSDSLTRALALKRLDRHGFHNFYTSASISPSLSQNSLKKIHSYKDSSFSRFNHSISEYLCASSVNPNIHRFVNLYPSFIVIHSRDSAYSGNTQSWRDSNFDNFDLLVKYAKSVGLGVVRISTSSNPTRIRSENFFDLASLSKASLEDQLFVLKRASFFIGTGSGISHWHYLNPCPVLFINTVVMQVTVFSDSVLLSPKRFTRDHRLVFDSSYLPSFATQWSSDLIQNLQPRELSPLEILNDVQYFLNACTNNQLPLYTLHAALSELGIEDQGIPDSIITKDYFHYLVGT
jgi:putative glycosyltransferase (TIGR04372 family)